MRMPEYVFECISRLKAAGYSAYAVGGAVRDSLIGAEPSDWDVTTSAIPEAVMNIFADERTVPTGLKHGTVTVLLPDGGVLRPIEVTTFRVDGEYRDARHPDSVSFAADVRDDLARRDFTVNAMAYSPSRGLVDAFGGAADLEGRIIRAVGDARVRFSEDSLRIMRAFRFSAQLGFDIEESTYLAACEKAHLIRNISRERIGAELLKMLGARAPAAALCKMVRGGVFAEAFGGISPDLDVVSRLDGTSDVSAEVRLAVLCFAMADSARAEFLSSLRLSNAQRKKVERFVAASGFVPMDGSTLGAQARRFLHLYGDILRGAISMLEFSRGECAGDLIREVLAQCVSDPPINAARLAVRGSDLLPICGEHALVGRVIAHLLECVIDDPDKNERETLLSLAREYIEGRRAE